LNYVSDKFIKSRKYYYFTAGWFLDDGFVMIKSREIFHRFVGRFSSINTKKSGAFALEYCAIKARARNSVTQ